MGFKDYFNDDLEDSEIDEELKEYVDDDIYYDKIDFDWKGKQYTSVKELRKELSTDDLYKVMEEYDKSILKSEKKMKYNKIKGWTFCGVFLAGVGLAILKNWQTGILKNFLDFFTPATMITGIVGAFLKSKHCCDEDEKYDKLFYVFEEIDEEIMLRESEKGYQEKSEEIFLI